MAIDCRQKRLVTCLDLPPDKAFVFLVENPTAEVINRVTCMVDENGDVWTWPDKSGAFGFRVEAWE